MVGNLQDVGGVGICEGGDWLSERRGQMASMTEYFRIDDPEVLEKKSAGEHRIRTGIVG